MVHHIHGKVEERVFSILPQTTITNCWGLAPRVHLCLHFGEDLQIFSEFFNVGRFVDSICWTNKAYTCKYFLSNK